MVDAEESYSRSRASTETSNSDLIAGVHNEITMGCIISRLPWYEIPLLRTLNRTWDATLKSSNYANYFRHHQCHVLAKSIVFYMKSASTGDHKLLLYQNGLVRRLPLPCSIPSRSMLKILVTGHCIYFLTLAENDQSMYNVYTLDLARGMIGWQSLSPLPNRGNCVYVARCPDGNSAYMLMLNDTLSKEAENKWSVWMHKIKANGSFSKWRSIPLSLPLLNQLTKKSYPPKYLDIQTSDEKRHIYGRVSPVSLSQLAIMKICEPEHHHYPEVLLVFREDHGFGVVSKISRICWHGNSQHERFTVLLNKIKVQNVEEDDTIKDQGEPSAFQRWWRSRCGNELMGGDQKATFKLDKRWLGMETIFSFEENNYMLNKSFMLGHQGFVWPYIRLASAWPPEMTFQYVVNREYIRGGGKFWLDTSFD